MDWTSKTGQLTWWRWPPEPLHTASLVGLDISQHAIWFPRWSIPNEHCKEPQQKMQDLCAKLETPRMSTTFYFLANHSGCSWFKASEMSLYFLCEKQHVCMERKGMMESILGDLLRIPLKMERTTDSYFAMYRLWQIFFSSRLAMNHLLISSSNLLLHDHENRNCLNSHVVKTVTC